MSRFLPSRAIARLGPALRSWRREEQRPMARRRLQEALWRLSAALLLGLTALALRSMVIQQHETRVAERQEALTTLQHTLRLTLQTVQDWGHWTEMYAYVEAPEPTFLDVNIRRSGLLQLEGVMLVFDRQHNLLFSADREGFNHPEHRTLVDCLRPDLPGLKGVEDSRFFLCSSGPKGMVYVGSILPISDSRSEKAANGTIGFLLPLQEAGSPARSSRILNQLLADLRPVPRHLTSPPSPQLISLQDKLGQPLLARPDHQILQRAGGPWESAAGPLKTALAMVILGSCTALVLRMVWMLEQRRQRLAQCRLDINRRLQQRRQLAEEQRRQIEQKLSSSLTAAAVAHDIQQPLSTILLHCRLALQDLSGSGVGEGLPSSYTSREHRLVHRLEALSAEARRAAKITETMRMLLRNVHTPHHPVNLQTVVESSLLFFRRPLSNHGITLQTRGLDQPTLLAGDATQLQSALNNLIQNSIDAMVVDLSAPTAGSSDIESTNACILRVTLISDPAQIRLIVADSGPGFANPNQAIPLATPTGQARGIGLFVVQTTMLNHGGSLHFGRSQDLGGAEVQMHWPRPTPWTGQPSGPGGQAEPAQQDAERAEHHHR